MGPDPNLMMRYLFVRVGVVLLATLALTACGGGARLGLGSKPDEQAQTVNLQRDNTHNGRAVQVAWTAARAQYCAFGMDRNKLRAPTIWLSRLPGGAPPETMQSIEKMYDTTYEAFYARIRGIENYCSKERIEEIRPEIRRHLAGDYTPSARKPPKADPSEVYIPPAKEDVFKRDPDGDPLRDW